MMTPPYHYPQLILKAMKDSFLPVYFILCSCMMIRYSDLVMTLVIPSPTTDDCTINPRDCQIIRWTCSNAHVFNFVLQKWSKGKVRDKLNNQVLFDKATYEKLLKEVPAYKLITPSVVSERLKIRGSLARRALDELIQKGEHFTVSLLLLPLQLSQFTNLILLFTLIGLIKQVIKHHAQVIYTRATKGDDPA